MDSIVIYGGSFDPIHNGHIRTALASSRYFDAKVIFVPAKNPRFKVLDSTPSQRLDMLKLAIKDLNPSIFMISLFEMDSYDEINYSIDTVRYFKNKFKQANLYFLIGADEANSFSKWKEAESIASIVKIVYVPRPGVKVDEENIKKYNMACLPFTKTGEVSSSGVRKLENIDIPLSVRKYIEENGLYYINELKKLESQHRLSHSISVANLSYRIAVSNKLKNPNDYYVSGLLHDLGKDLEVNNAKLIMQNNYPKYISYPFWTYHQFIGEFLAKKIFNIDNNEILEAIKFHATGNKNMTTMGKVIYSSDKIEPSRGYDSSDLINSCLSNCQDGFIKVLKANQEYLEKKGYIVDNDLTNDCYKQYLGE
ncbi:MAG TPA: nicotinate (nicotinamide) nucleotide adenylyltransferase [Firmicutes bacterium]|nr:nicotinate (nicotinamide) nucleotide adenylyltransferase [Bacillota bacterium]